MTPLARTTDPDTSYDAAIRMADHIARQEAMIWDVLCCFGPLNAEGIADRICERYSWKPDSVAVCRRFKLMEGRLIEYAGYTLPQTTGRRARAMQVIQTDRAAA